MTAAVISAPEGPDCVERLPALPPSLVPHIAAIDRALTRARQALLAGQIETVRRNLELAQNTAQLIARAGR